MINLKRLFFSTLSILFVCSPVIAEECPKCDQIAQKVFPNSPLMNKRVLSKGPMVELIAGNKKIFYTDGEKYLFVGGVIDLETMENITQTRYNELNRIDFSILPLEKSILVSGSGNSSRKIAIFHDVDCPFCRKLWNELPNIEKGIDVHVFLYPLMNLHPFALKKSMDVWCSKDRAEALYKATHGMALESR